MPKYKSAGAKAFCSYCKDHLFTLIRDIYYGEPVHINQINPKVGQNIIGGMRMTCKRCGIEYGPNQGIDWEDAL